MHVETPIQLDPKLPATDSYKWWQCGTGIQVGAKRQILGSITLTANTDNLSAIRILHVVILGSSKRVVVRNVRWTSYVVQYSGNKILIPPVKGFRASITMDSDRLHSFTSLGKIKVAVSTSSVVSRHTDSINIDE